MRQHDIPEEEERYFKKHVDNLRNEDFAFELTVANKQWWVYRSNYKGDKRTLAFAWPEGKEGMMMVGMFDPGHDYDEAACRAILAKDEPS